ncbi:MAG: RsmD family RNA methyltransferase, partial [Verrucomicrobiota bacterium]
ESACVIYSCAMRITGGRFGGLQVSAPDRRMRPTRDMVREALFSILGEQITGGKFADLFAGSGIVGMEAASRGADEVWWIEKAGRSCSVLKRVSQKFPDFAGRIIRADVCRALGGVLRGERFDIVFADPPYLEPGPADGEACGAAGWREYLLRKIPAFDVIADGGLFIFESEKRDIVGEETRQHEGWKTIDIRTYGGTGLCFYLRG